MIKDNIIKFKNDTTKSYADKLKKLKFGLHKYTFVSGAGLKKDYWFIAIKDRETNVTLELTSFTKFLRYTIRSIDSRESETIRTKGVFICMFLNYLLIDNYEEYKLDNIADITIDHGNKFLKAYADGIVGGKSKTLKTIEDAVLKLTIFYSDLQSIYKKEAKYIYNINLKEINSDGKVKYKPPFKINVDVVNGEPIFRDMPEEVFWVMLELSKQYYPELTLAIALQAFAGLRPGEVCNVRQARCKLDGGGIKISKVVNKLRYFEINLLNKYPMRADLKDVGGIKKKRKQKVYDKYLPTIKKLYERHMKILAESNLEDGYYPMFISEEGKALTVSSYRDKLDRLINTHLKKALLESNNNYFRFYGEILTQRKLAPHFLRHWFTVRLVLDNLPPHTVAEWRGDNNLDTSLAYCANKEELKKSIYNSNSKTVNEILENKYGRS